MSKKKLSERDQAFYQGVIAALAVVRLFDSETLYHEIVGSVGKDGLLAAADNEDREWCGLIKYGYCKAPKPEAKRKPSENSVK